MLTTVAHASSGLGNAEAIGAIVIAVLTLFAAFGTERGRTAVSRMFRGQSLQDLAAANADRMAAVESSYNVLNAEHERMKHDYEVATERLESENLALRDRVTTLEAQVKSMASIDTLTKVVRNNHDEVMAAIGTLR